VRESVTLGSSWHLTLHKVDALVFLHLVTGDTDSANQSSFEFSDSSLDMRNKFTAVIGLL